MLLLNSLRKMVGRAASRKVRRPKVRPVGFRPSIEALEDRTVPAPLVVTTIADNGTGSLRAAIALAEVLPDPDVIVFDPAVAGKTIALSTVGDTSIGPSGLYVSTPITIEGTGETITRAAGAPTFRLFAVGAVGSLTLRNLTLTGGLAQGGNAGDGDGGGGAGLGGAIYNRRGTVELVGCTLTGNQAIGGRGGRGVFSSGGGGAGMGGAGDRDNGNGGGPLGGRAGQDAPNSGGDGDPGGNGGFGGGGGLGGMGEDNFDPKFLGNGGNGGNGGFGGGGGVGGFAHSTRGTGGRGGDGGFGGGGGTGGAFGGSSGTGGSGGSGGFGGGSGGSTVSSTGVNPDEGGGGGGAGMGGAIFNQGGTVTIANTTITGNVARGGDTPGKRAGAGSGFGGGLFNLNGDVTLAHVTLFANPVAAGAATGVGGIPGSADGGGFYSLSLNVGADTTGTLATVTIANSIVVGTPGLGHDGVNLQALVDATGPNLTSNGGFSNSGAFIGTPFTEGDAKLGPLQDNGGFTRTMAPLPGSPAIDHGSNTAADAAGLTTDQRGDGFFRVRNGTADLGAVEVQAGSLPPPQRQPEQQQQQQTNQQTNAVLPLTDVTDQVKVARGRLRFDKRTGMTRLWLRLTNSGPGPLTGPVSFVLVGLPKGVTLRGRTGWTTQLLPGSAFQNLPLGPAKLVLVTVGLPPGAVVTDLGGDGKEFLPGETRPLRLTFRNPAGARFRFRWRILAGLGVR